MANAPRWPWVALIAGLLRLPGLAAAPFEMHHIRQCDSASLALNFARHGLDLLHPRIHWAGPEPGVVETALPLYSWLLGLLWRLTGVAPVVGRLLSMAAWVAALWALERLVDRRLPKDWPRWPALVLLAFSPLSIFFSRALQPEVFALALGLGGLVAWDAYLATAVAEDGGRSGSAAEQPATGGPEEPAALDGAGPRSSREEDDDAAPDEAWRRAGFEDPYARTQAGETRRAALPGQLPLLLLASAALSLALLSSPYTATLLAVAALAAWEKGGVVGLARLPIWTLLGLVVVAAAAWVGHARLSLAASGFTIGWWELGASPWGGPGVWLSGTFWRASLGVALTQSLTPAGGMAIAAGLLSARSQLQPLRLFLGWLLLALLAVGLWAAAMTRFNYLQLHLLPPASVLAGVGATWIARQARSRTVWRAAALALVLATAASGWLGWRFLQTAYEQDRRIARIGDVIRNYVPVEAPVVVVDAHPQSLFWAADRRGWYRITLRSADVARLSLAGARYLVLADGSPVWQQTDLRTALTRQYPTVVEGTELAILDLAQESP